MTIGRNVFLFLLHLCLLSAAFGQDQNSGIIRGTVTVGSKSTAVRGLPVLLVQANRTVETADDGSFEFQNVPPGKYDVVASSAGVASDLTTVTVAIEATVTIDLKLNLSPIKNPVTVTASGTEVPAIRAFQTVNTLDSFDLAEKSSTGLGDVLQDQPGIAKRSFGPGATRPVIRGFDGDRVLILQDGIRTGTLSSQSGDHGEPVDVFGLERLEVLKGPATLLYGSTAIGGVVNGVSGHHQFKEHNQPGFRSWLTGVGGNANRQGAGAIGFEYAVKNWVAWGSGSNDKTGDYSSARGRVQNSGSRLTDGTIGGGWYGKTRYGAVSYEYGDGNYGIPLAPPRLDDTTGAVSRDTPATLDFYRRNVRLSGGARDLGRFIDGVRASLAYTSWNHQEIDLLRTGPQANTTFDNKDYTYQAFFDQKNRERLTGTLGIYGTHRKFFSGGAEAIAPPVKEDVAALFGVEELAFDRFRVQFGGRVERTTYKPRQVTQELPLPTGEGEPAPELPPQPKDRKFTAVSGALGINVPVWRSGAFIANYTHSYRAPALEELYNNGPHAALRTFEAGNDDLRNERNDGIELSYRHLVRDLRASGSYYLYRLDNLVFLAPTGNQRGDLVESMYMQQNASYMGAEGSFDVQVRPMVWFNGGVDYVRAELRGTNTPLPRIPPLRGRAGFDVIYRSISFKPEVVVANAQNRVFQSETATPGYTVFNMSVSYTLAKQRSSHHIALNAFNLGDRYYLNHVSFVKDIAPEVGRGVRLTYSVRFF